MANLPRSRIIIASGPDASYLIFHVTTRLSATCVQEFGFPLENENGECLKRTGIWGAPLVQKLADILGIEAVILELYSLHVKIGEAFDWTSFGILEKVIGLLKECFGSEKDNVLVILLDEEYEDEPDDREPAEI